MGTRRRIRRFSSRRPGALDMALKFHAYCPQPHGVGAGRGFAASITSTIRNTFQDRDRPGREGGNGGEVGGVDGGEDNACRHNRQICRWCSRNKTK